MPDMLVRLYDLPDPATYYRRAAESGATLRRAQPWERPALRAFIEGRFSSTWAHETEVAFSRQPVSAFPALGEREIVGFAAYECTRRGYFGPTGVREELRGKGIGAALLFRCLEGLWELGYAYGIIGGVWPGEVLREALWRLRRPRQRSRHLRRLTRTRPSRRPCRSAVPQSPGRPH